MSLPALLDTNTVSFIMRDVPSVRAQAAVYLREHDRPAFSYMTRYEILRGLLLRGSLRRQRAIERLCAESELISLTPAIMDTAATIYADLYRRGQLIGDADILIAASALVNVRRLITDNVAHLARIPDLTVENWFSPA